MVHLARYTPPREALAACTDSAVFTISTQWAAAKSDAATQVRRADDAIARAASQDVALLAPATFSEAAREYNGAKVALKNKHEKEATEAAERAR